MKIYTKTGDKGYTSLLGKKRILKSDLQVIAYGSIDKINAYIGYIYSDKKLPILYKNEIHNIIKDLFNIGAELAIVQHDNTKIQLKNTIQYNRITYIESFIDKINKQLPKLKKFILPIGCELSCKCNLARVEIRETEQIIIALNKTYNNIRPEIIIYLNRLSDLFFTISRALNNLFHKNEIIW